jgi:hypothetical protein
MAFIWLHCAYQQDRVIYLKTLKEAYDAGLLYIRNTSRACRFVQFEQIENSIFDHKNLFPIAECGDVQVIIGYGNLDTTALMFFNGNKNIYNIIVP